jgi:hypothetical protein
LISLDGNVRMHPMDVSVWLSFFGGITLGVLTHRDVLEVGIHVLSTEVLA